ncbi:hypothetical protein D3C87_2114090 [compost metagenome]
MEVIVPTEEEIKKFHSVQVSLLNRMNTIRAENTNIIKLRDTLLPKFMNGEINLENIEI